MIPLISLRKSQIILACHQCGVARLDVFGSAATGAFDEASSDIDFLVSFSPSARERAFDNYFDLKERLEEIFERPVDLVTEPSIRNEILREQIQRDRQMVYAA